MCAWVHLALFAADVDSENREAVPVIAEHLLAHPLHLCAFLQLTSLADIWTLALTHVKITANRPAHCGLNGNKEHARCTKIILQHETICHEPRT